MQNNGRNDIGQHKYIAKIFIDIGCPILFLGTYALRNLTFVGPEQDIFPHVILPVEPSGQKLKTGPGCICSCSDGHWHLGTFHIILLHVFLKYHCCSDLVTHRRQLALHLLHCCMRHLQPDGVTCSAAMNACERGVAMLGIVVCGFLGFVRAWPGLSCCFADESMKIMKICFTLSPCKVIDFHLG